MLRIIFLSCMLVFSTVQANPQFMAIYDQSNRIQNVQYEPNVVVKIVGFKDNPTLIVFEKGENVADVSGGTVLNWGLSKKGSHLFFWPEVGAKTSTVLVTTNKRSYVLDLIPAKKGDSFANRVSKVIYSYSKKGEDSRSRVEAGAVVASKNDLYTMEIVNDEAYINPSEVFDDGTFTYFKFDKNAEIPAIYKSKPGVEAEWLINKHKENGYIVIHGVSPLWNLRLGNALVGVYNEAFRPGQESNHVNH